MTPANDSPLAALHAPPPSTPASDAAASHALWLALEAAGARDRHALGARLADTAPEQAPDVERRVA